MNLKNYYWYFQSAIPPKICDDIIKYGLDQQEQTALTGNLKSDKELTDMINGEGYKIARRTITKYREQLKFPTTRLRRKL